MFSLTEQQLEQFKTQGWVGPFPFLSDEETCLLKTELRRCFNLSRGFFYPEQVEPGVSYYNDMPWFQSLHSLSPKIRAVGRRPEIVDRVSQLLGDDLMQWASICFPQGPKESLHWHSDTEYDYFNAVGIWVGIDNVTPETALKLLPGSHLLNQFPEDFIGGTGMDMKELSPDQVMLNIANKIAKDFIAEPIRPQMKDGEFIILTGKLWHASDNPSDKDRTAMGLRYSPPDQKIRIPLTYLHPVQWDPTPPPCVIVKGEDRWGLNELMD